MHKSFGLLALSRNTQVLQHKRHSNIRTQNSKHDTTNYQNKITSLTHNKLKTHSNTTKLKQTKKQKSTLKTKVSPKVTKIQHNTIIIILLWARILRFCLYLSLSFLSVLQLLIILVSKLIVFQRSYVLTYNLSIPLFNYFCTYYATPKEKISHYKQSGAL